MLIFWFWISKLIVVRYTAKGYIAHAPKKHSPTTESYLHVATVSSFQPRLHNFSVTNNIIWRWGVIEKSSIVDIVFHLFICPCLPVDTLIIFPALDLFELYRLITPLNYFPLNRNTSTNTYLAANYAYSYSRFSNQTSKLSKLMWLDLGKPTFQYIFQISVV